MRDSKKPKVKLSASIKGQKEELVSDKVIDISTIGINGQVDLKSTSTNSKGLNKCLQFGISISQGSSPFDASVIVTIVPRYILINKLEHPLIVSQYTTKQEGQSMELTNEDDENQNQQEFHFNHPGTGSIENQLIVTA